MSALFFCRKGGFLLSVQAGIDKADKGIYISRKGESEK